MDASPTPVTSTPPQPQSDRGPPVVTRRPSRKRWRLLWSGLLLVAILLLPIPGQEPRPGERPPLVVGALAEGYRTVLGYPIVGMLMRFASQAEADGHVADAERDYGLALSIAKYVLGQDQPIVAYANLRLGDLYRRQGRFAESVPLYRRAQGTYYWFPDRNQALLAHSHESLARSLQNMGELLEARNEANRAVGFRERLGEDQALASTLGLLGDLELARRDPGQAKPALQRAVSILDADPDTDDLELARALNNLGIAQQQTGELDQAEATFRRSLQIRQDELGPNSPDVAKMLNNLGTVANQRGDSATARRLFEQALDIYEHHPQLSAGAIDPIGNLGAMARTEGHYVEAEALLRRALSIQERIAANDPKLADNMYALGQVLMDTGRPGQALPVVQRALSMRQKQLGELATASFASAEQLAGVYVTLEQPAAAEEVLRPALPLAEHMLGPNATIVMRMRVDAAAAYREEGRYTEAEQILLATLEQMRGMKLTTPAEFAVPNLELSLVYVGQTRYAEAEDLLRQTLAVQEQVRGAAHPVLAATHEHLGRTYAAAGRDADAVASYERALALLRTPATLNDYASELRRLGRTAEADAAMAEAAELSQRVSTS